MNCISRVVVSVIVPKYDGANKCMYVRADKGTRHVVPYDFPEGA